MDFSVDQWLGIAGVIMSGFVAAGTLALAIATWRSLRQAIRLYKERQLDEIIEYAEDTTKLGGDTMLGDDTLGIKILGERRPLLGSFLMAMSSHREITRLQRRGNRIRQLVLMFKSEGLISAFDELMRALDTYVQLIGKQFAAMDPALMTETEDFRSARVTAAAHRSNMASYADRVMDEAAKLKISS